MSLSELFFLPYSSPPACDDDDVTKEVWVETACEIQRDLSLALRISHEPFWQLVATNPSFLPCLESYLRFGPRPYDLEHCDERKTEEIITVQEGIHRCVYLLFGRLACFRRSKVNGRTSDDMLAILTKKKVFDAANILDLCSVYSEGNSHRLRKLLELVFVEEQFSNSLRKIVEHVPTILNDLADELGVSLGAAAPLKLDDPHKDVLSWETLVDVIMFLADNAGSLLALTEAHRTTAELMHKRGMEVMFAAMYEAVFPTLGDELRTRGERDSSLSAEVKGLELRLNWTREAFVKLVRRLVVVSCIEPLLEQCGDYAGKDCPLADDFFQMMSSFANEQIFVEDYLAYNPLNEDLEVFEQSGVRTDEEMKQYVIESLRKLPKHGSASGQGQGHALQSLADIIASSIPSDPSSGRLRTPVTPPASPTLGAPARPSIQRKRVTGAKLESLITQVTDLLSDLGRGFVQACLERFDFNTELTINAILEDQLPPELVSMDRTTEWLPPPAQDEDVGCPQPGKAMGEHIGDFEQEEVDPELLKIKAIHKGKRDDTVGILTRKPELSVAEKERYWHYGNTTEFMPAARMAACDDDDEYDDTYDAEPEFRPEGASGLLEERSASPAPAFQPAPLNERKARGPKKWTQSDEEDEEGSDGEPRKPRDIFCDNPEDVRRRYEQRRGIGGHRGGGGSVRGAPRGQGQDDATLRSRRRKEQNKSVAGNHNRRAQAQWKRRPF